MTTLLAKLTTTRSLLQEEWVALLSELDSIDREFLFSMARAEREHNFGNKVYIRGLIEISNHCRNRCRYCGINGSNKELVRYRMNPDEILQCCIEAYKLGFRTFVLQGGEDVMLTDGLLTLLIRQIKQHCPETAVTLSLGERSRDSYRRLRESGADRYLLRHETAMPQLYHELHPHQRLERRMEALYALKELGYWTGAGFLVGLPNHSITDFAADFLFLQQLRPQMVGIGPFIPQAHTPLATHPAGDPELTVKLLALIRLLLPQSFLPATTALATLSFEARMEALQTSANVIMPNLTPWNYRPHYTLYDGKKQSGSEAAEELELIVRQLNETGLRAVHQ